MNHPQTWWKDAVIYQIYPISFSNSNGDGIGDLPGIAGKLTSKLDYLQDLGVSVLWLSPIYSIDPRYGTLEDWDNLLADVHSCGMKLMMDLVVNHTSDEYEWFIDSKSSKTNPKRDWYIWRPPRYDADGNHQPPNNWKAIFQVRQAVWDLMKFWIDRGCDGFRMDVINLISKVDGLPDAPVTAPDDEYQQATYFFADGPHVHEYIQEMNREVLSQHGLITVGETPFTKWALELAKYVLPENKELQMVFQFELVLLDSPRTVPRPPATHRPWKLSELKEIVTRWQRFERDAGFWNAVFIENHDQVCSVSRFGNDAEEWRAVSAKLLVIFEITLGGTQYIFQGQELGLKNFPREWGIEEYKDVASQNWYRRVLQKRKRESGKDDVDMSDILDGLQKKARDHGRVPMQWDLSAHAGFTTGTPWMRVNDNYQTWNTAAQLDNQQSNEKVFAYTRSYVDQRALVVLNFTSKEVMFVLPENQEQEGWSKFELAFGNYTNTRNSGARQVATKLRLEAYEGQVYFC
ncbi:glycoside hydrolase family 13 protein [Mycena epipterygia]|nr:glycoside hydrolase family 13 protein [Mycena epipterygia]